MYSITLTNLDTGETFRYPSHHLPSEWTREYLSSIGMTITVVKESK